MFTSKYKQDLYNDLSITIGDTVVDYSSQVKDLWVIFDRVLSLRQHVSYTSKNKGVHTAGHFLLLVRLITRISQPAE